MIDQTNGSESIDPTKDPKYWEAMEKRNARINRAIKKSLCSTLKFMRELTQSEVTIYGLPFAEKQARFCFDGTSLSFLLQLKGEEETMHDITPKEYDSLRVITKNGYYLIPKAYVSSSGEIGNKVDVRCHVRFDELSGLEWNKKKTYYYRFLLPIQSDNWSRHIDNSFYHYRNTANQCGFIKEGSRCGLIRIDIPGKGKIHIFPVGIGLYGQCTTAKSQYLVIESQFPCRYRDMHEYVYAISLSLGLVTSIAPFDYAFVIASGIQEFDGKIMGSIVKLRPTIRGQISFFTTSIGLLRKHLKGKADYAFPPDCDKEGNLLRSYLDPMTEQDFSGLVSMLHRSKDLARAALMLIDSSMNLECMGVTYAVALETICSVLIEANKESFSDYFEKRPWDDEWISNTNKLTRPFEQLVEIGHELSEEKRDELVDIRNSFLHGGVLGFSHTEYHKLQYPCMKLRCFCGILLLRYSGYKGPILNNAVEMGLEEALKNKEPLFITYDEEAAKELVEKRKNEKQKEKEEEKKKKKSKSRQKQHTKSRQEQQAKSRQKQHANQSKNNTRNQGKEKSPQPTEKPEASV